MARNGNEALREPARWQPDGSDAASSPQADPAERERRLANLRALAARIDTAPRWVDVVRRLRRRLPGDARFGDPLSTAGQAPVEVIARGVTTWRAEESVVKELGLAGLQLWQSLSEAAGRGRGELELAILFTDLAGFSSWALKAGDAAALELLRAVGAATEGAVLAHQGRIVKRLGDGLMATFLSAQAAVEAALDAQAAIAEIELDGYRPRMRAGVHWGRPRKLGGDYLGVDVNIAARVVQAAKAGELLVSDTVLERLAAEDLSTGRSRRLKAEGAPRELHVAPVSRG
ncbi:MAG TPA: adenylate/guanylate cyclase domain-containing protein [Solirubrobacteraceae bacterium]|nr:adenylate/guanylate cyclase domain-containing protein [Solirubrobacteraceae bacterium]